MKWAIAMLFVVIGVQASFSQAEVGLGIKGGGGYDTVIPYARATTTWRCNWKLLVDTFLESYHVPALHKASLGAAYIGAASPFDAFGPHNRIVVPQRALLDQAKMICSRQCS